MTVQANSSAFPMLNDMSYKPYTYNQSMLSNDACFNTSDSFLGDTNNDLHFDEFILNCQAISHVSSLDETKNMDDVENLYMDNDSNEFFIERIPKQQKDVLQALSSTKPIPSTESSVGIDDNRKNEEIGSHSLDQISEPITAAVNILSTTSSEDNADPNWHISFMTMIEKPSLLPNSAMILPKMIFLSHSLEYLNNLWHIDSGTKTHIFISRQRFLDYHPIDKKEDVCTGAGSIQAIGIGTV